MVKGERAWVREGKGEQGVDFSEPPLNERCKAFKLRIKKRNNAGKKNKRTE